MHQQHPSSERSSRFWMIAVAIVASLIVAPVAFARNRTDVVMRLNGSTASDPLGWNAIAAELNNPLVPWTLCARQNGYCAFTGTMMVRYGLPGTYAYQLRTNGTKCTNSVFGNPLPGKTKYCAYRPWNVLPTTVTPTPTPTTTPPTAPPTVPPTSPPTVPPTTTPPTTTPPTPATTVPFVPATPTGAIPSNFNLSPYIRTGGDIPGSSAADPTGNFRLICDFSHLAYDDPIVFPGQPGASHLHMFFGNTGTNASSTYQSLRTTGDGTCQGGPINRTAYWAPALFNAAGQVVIPDFASVYYKDGAAAQMGQKVIELPVALKMIAGYNMAAPGGATHFDWYCEQGTTKTQTIPNCPTGQRVGVALTFPACWDGKNTDSADHRSHLAYFSYGANGPECPATHPLHIPQVSIGLWFTHDGNSANWYLASDRMAGMTHANGTTFHADWMGAWDPGIQTKWTTLCINGLLSCSGGQLGDGSWLTGEKSYTGPKLVAPPARV